MIWQQSAPVRPDRPIVPANACAVFLGYLECKNQGPQAAGLGEHGAGAGGRTVGDSAVAAWLTAAVQIWEDMAWSPHPGNAGGTMYT